MFKNVKIILISFLILLCFGAFAQTYHVDGYVVEEGSWLPVENQIIEIYNEQGEVLELIFTDGQGFYSGDFEIDVDSSSYVVVAVWRICEGISEFYSQQVELNKPWLTASFFVCEDEPCHADFNVTQIYPDQLQFQFTDVSHGDISDWYWDFGDGTFSTLQSPLHTYLQPSHYQVKLEVSGVNCIDERQKGAFAFTRDCLAKFSWDQINQDDNLIVQFTDESLGGATSWQWDFGDGTLSDLQHPSHEYDMPGDYEVELTIFRPGCWHPTRSIIQVNPLPQCYAHFGSEQVISENLELLFTDLSISDSISSWFWQFGDGAESNLKNPVHIFDEPGNYNVSLSITTAGCSDIFLRNMKIIEANGCLADFEYSQAYPDVPEVLFENLAPADSLNYFWDFGDGNVSFGYTPSHLYDDFGNYQVILHVLGYGCADTITKLIELIEPVSCGADFTFEQSFPQSRLFAFTNQSFGNDFSSLWDFGDGNSSAEVDPWHEYAAAGQYEVQLNIFSSDSCTDSMIKIVEVFPPITISGKVWAGESLLTTGRVLLFKGTTIAEIELYEEYILSEGVFSFSELNPGEYFLQAIPEFNFPFPIIPNYFPSYLEREMKWSDAQVINTDNLPDDVQIQLLHYNDFFDGDASLKGSVSRESESTDIPIIIYLLNDADQIMDYRLVEDDDSFEFILIPYGHYNVYPEKAGKIGQAFSIELNEDFPEMDNLVFIESSDQIVPDLTSIEEQGSVKVSIIPNPANSRISVLLPDDLNANDFEIRIYNGNGLSLPVSHLDMKTHTIDVSGYPQGVYFLELEAKTIKVQRAFIIHR